MMLDGSDLSLPERLRYALGLLTPSERQERIERSPQQLRRYLDGADPPFSVLVMVGAATGVPVGWLADGRADLTAEDEGLFGVPGEPDPVAIGAGLAGAGRSRRPGGGLGPLSPGFGVAPAVTPGMASRPGVVGLAWQANPDRLAKAYDMARNGIVSAPGKQPDSKRLMQVTLLIYDQLTEDEGGPPEVQQ